MKRRIRRTRKSAAPKRIRVGGNIYELVKLSSAELTPKDMDRLYRNHMSGKGGYIQSKTNPEWGFWKVTNKTTHDGVTWWDIEGDRGGTTLGVSELRFWEEASPSWSQWKPGE